MARPVNIRMVKINTPERFAQAQDDLGCNNTEMGEALRLSKDGRETVRRYRDGSNTRGIPGAVQIAMEAFISGFRPRGVKFPCDARKG